MQTFLKIATQMLPAERIESINRNAVIGSEPGIEVKLFGIPETFQYTGQYASLAWDVLDGVNPVSVPPVASPTVVVTVNGGAPPFALVEVDDQQYRLVTVSQGPQVNTDDIEWVDFASTIGTQQGIELRLATDAPGVTRKFVGEDASTAYDVLVQLSSNEEVAAARY